MNIALTVIAIGVGASAAIFGYDWRMHPICSAIGRVGCGDNAHTRRKNLFSDVVYCSIHNPEPGKPSCRSGCCHG